MIGLLSTAHGVEMTGVKMIPFQELDQRIGTLLLAVIFLYNKTRWKRPRCWERLRAGGERSAEDEMVGWHHQLIRHEFEQTQGDNEGQGRLACGSP